MNQISLNLPWPPSVNAYWRSPNKGPLAGRTLISEKGRAYRTNVLAAVSNHCFLTHQEARPLIPCARLAVALYAYPPDRRRRDIDNLPKAALDALTHAGVWADDEQIDFLSIQRCDVLRPIGWLRVVITEITDGATRPRQSDGLGASVAGSGADFGTDF